MCSIFFISGHANSSPVFTHKYSQKRGPDYTGCFTKDSLSFVHNLLSITGNNVIQPLVDNQKVAMFNGELYTFHSSFNSEVAHLISCDFTMNALVDFFGQLDGEFACILADISSGKLFAITDIFSTKPLWYGFGPNSWGLSTIRESLHNLEVSSTVQLPPSSIFEFNINTGKIQNHSVYFRFDLEQKYDSFERWYLAFEAAVKKRICSKSKVAVPLSSGHDSGAIAAACISLDLPVTFYSILLGETLDVLNDRASLIKENNKMNHQIFSAFDARLSESHLKQNCPNIQYSQYMPNSLRSIYTDPGALGMSAICRAAERVGDKIIISGQGADEIISDYAMNGNKLSPNSNFSGIFPEKLSNIFPWRNFFNDVNRCYLLKDEYVVGSHGMEGRYPFLDKQLVQEFLWLSSSLKNSEYKAPVTNYLKKKNFPINDNVKLGFNPS